MIRGQGAGSKDLVEAEGTIEGQRDVSPRCRERVAGNTNASLGVSGHDLEVGPMA